MRNISVVIILVLLIVSSGCRENKLDVDISGVKTQPLKVLRLEKDLFSLNSQNFSSRSKEIRDQYGVYYEHYLMGFLSRRGTADSAYQSAVLAYTGDRDVREAYDYVRKIYPDSRLDEMTPELNNMVKRFHYHFPEKPVPSKLITVLSGWNYAFAYMDSALILSLDMYLGDTAKFYQMLRYPQYQTRKMNADYILPDMARGWLLTEFDNSAIENTLLHHTIYYGKLFYAVNALLPEEKDSVIIGYNSAQMKYCSQFEKKLWGYFAANNRLYENNMNTVRELTTDGPFTAAISKECPPRIAMWIGWQIVRAYMKNNEQVSLSQLMAEKDAQKILSKSKYRP